MASCNVVKDLKTAIIEAKQDNKFNHETQENKRVPREDSFVLCKVYITSELSSTGSFTVSSTGAAGASAC